MTVKARAADGAEVELAQDTFEALRRDLKGQLLLPRDPGYDDARSIWNAMIDRRPALIARCLGATDVLAAVKFARERRLAVPPVA